MSDHSFNALYECFCPKCEPGGLRNITYKPATELIWVALYSVQCSHINSKNFYENVDINNNSQGYLGEENKYHIKDFWAFVQQKCFSYFFVIARVFIYSIFNTLWKKNNNNIIHTGYINRLGQVPSSTER